MCSAVLPPHQPLQNVLSYLGFLNSINLEAKFCPPANFYSGAVSDLADDILKTDYIRWMQTRRTAPDSFAFCKYPFLFNADAKRRILHVDVEARQAMVRSPTLCRSVEEARICVLSTFTMCRRCKTP